MHRRHAGEIRHVLLRQGKVAPIVLDPAIGSKTAKKFADQLAEAFGRRFASQGDKPFGLGPQPRETLEGQSARKGRVGVEACLDPHAVKRYGLDGQGNRFRLTIGGGV